MRVLAATNAPLEERVDEGSFREDLFYRLDVTRVELPPLRARRDDLPLLIKHFLAGFGRADATVSPRALRVLAARSWPGNVRELRNAVESALTALGTGNRLEPEHFPPPARSNAPPPGDSGFAAAVRAAVLAGARNEGRASFQDLKSELERVAVATALEITGGNQVAAARLLGMNRASFRRKMAEHGLSRPSEAPGS
ncbi:MAG: sigma-54-dependent Fis family transcriptional regulator [Planctomycetota bacterium]|nr:MAG: sigma-54-dependent Fis family transcriptional regulator [Planctomycetota bacterium]